MRQWSPVDVSDWSLKGAASVCAHLDCGSAVSVRLTKATGFYPLTVRSDCVKSGSALRTCTTFMSSSFMIKLNCTGKHIISIQIIFFMWIESTISVSTLLG